jgi:hypothetical protein
MTRYYVLSPLILAGALFASTALRAQEPVLPVGQSAAGAADRKVDLEDSPVFDDDGGRVFIITRGQTPDLSKLSFHGGEVINQPRQVSIFLGNGWSNPAFKPTEAGLSGTLARLGRSTEGAELEKRGVSLVLPGLEYEEPWQFEEGPDGNVSVSDLQIQGVLSNLIENRQIVPPDANTIYAVFLSSELKSTIGGLLGRKHYLAYHNFFHVESAQVRYTLMPFEANPKAARSTATQVLVRAVLNPSGSGWF